MGLIADGAILQNEVKAWPPLVQIGVGLDLVTQNQWWDTVGTPTTEATAVPVSGEAGLEAKFTQVIKCVTDSANEGFKQRYTYADEPRIKSGAVISALIWVAHASGVASCDVTVKLVNSDATEAVGTVIASTTDWECHLVEGHSCAGTYVELQVTKDTAGTFYAGGPITVMLGASAIGLPPRKEIFRWRDFGADHDFDFTTDSGGFTDADVTAFTSNLACRAQMFCLVETPDGSANLSYELTVRRNGSSVSAGESNKVASTRTNTSAGRDSARSLSSFPILLDDAQIFEYDFNHAEGVTSAGGLSGMSVVGYWEWE